MICQRCGSCCVTMFVVVPVVGPWGLHAVAKPDNVRCPNLLADSEGKLSCAVHDLPEYKGSPCWIYGNSKVDPDFICKRGKPCQVGTLWQQRGGFPVPAHTTDQLEDLGPWQNG
jgi:hypothetical protein